MTVARALTYHLAFAIAVAAGGCVVPPPLTYSSPPSSAPSTFSHSFEVVVQDFQKNPLQGVTVTFDITANDSGRLSQQTCITREEGRCGVSVDVPRDPKYTYVTSFTSEAKVSTVLEGYYGASGSMYNSAGSSPSGRAAGTATLIMFRPSDFLADTFVNSSQDAALREQALRFISLIRLQSVIVDTDLQPKSVGTLDYKAKKYLRLAFTSDNTYNSLKLSRYQIGQRLFDDSVRKLLSPLNTNVASPKAFYGYDIVMKSSTKDFSDKYATPISLEYRFLMPQEAVRRYKDQDMSGQQLIDQSIVLLNDERIDLKLQ